MSINDVVATLNAITDRAELVAFMAPLRLPNTLSDLDKGRLHAALRGACALRLEEEVCGISAKTRGPLLRNTWSEGNAICDDGDPG